MTSEIHSIDPILVTGFYEFMNADGNIRAARSGETLAKCFALYYIKHNEEFRLLFSDEAFAEMTIEVSTEFVARFSIFMHSVFLTPWETDDSIAEFVHKESDCACLLRPLKWYTRSIAHAFKFGMERHRLERTD